MLFLSALKDCPTFDSLLLTNRITSPRLGPRPRNLGKPDHGQIYIYTKTHPL